jgi:DNA-binding winged helix-turn-helix (wHTH) protein
MTEALHLSADGVMSMGEMGVRLTPVEQRFVSVLADRPRQLVEYGQLRQAVWGDEGHDLSDRVVGVHLTHIRAKLHRISLYPIATAWGQGLVWTGPPLAQDKNRVTVTLDARDWKRLAAHIEATGETASEAIAGFVRDALDMWGGEA